MGNRYVPTVRRAIVAALCVAATSFGLSGIFKTPDSRPGPSLEVAAAVSDRAPASATVTAVNVDVTLLQVRADAWHVAYTSERDRNVEEAVAIAARVQAEERAVGEFLASVSATTAPPPAPVPDDDQVVEATPTVPPAPETTVAPTTTEVPPATDPPAPAATTALPDAFARLRDCESDGNYAAVSRSGRYRGAYQFSQATWDWVASARFPHLVGIDPAAAAPSDQDAMAMALFEIQGPSAWPVCRYVFG